MGHVALPQFSAMMAEMLLRRQDAGAAETWLTGASVSKAHTTIDNSPRKCIGCQPSAGHAQPDGRRARASAEGVDIARLQGAALLELRAALILARHDLPEGRAALKA